jgi:hypothetical protein
MKILLIMAVAALLGGCGVRYSGYTHYYGDSPPHVIKQAGAAVDAGVVGALSSVLGPPTSASYNGNEHVTVDRYCSDYGGGCRQHNRWSLNTNQRYTWGDPRRGYGW